MFQAGDMAMTSLSAKQTEGFSMSFYVQTVFGILGQPRRFFSELPLTVGLMRALFFPGGIRPVFLRRKPAEHPA